MAKVHITDELIFEADIRYMADSGNPDEYKHRRKGATEDRWYSSHNGSTALATAVIVANKFYAMPLLVSKKITIDKYAINVTSAGAASTKGRFGIYADDGNCYPGLLISGSAEAAMDGSTGVRTEDKTAAPIVLSPGLYWLAFVSSGAPTLRGHAVGCTTPLLGMDNTLGTASGVGWVADFTYAALPATFPTTNRAVLTAAPLPAVFIRTI